MGKAINKIQIVLALILLLSLGVLGYLKATTYLDLYNYSHDLETSISNSSAAIDELSSTLAEAKLVFRDTDSSKNEEIANVLPKSEDLTSLTRAFDDFAVENNFSNAPFFISSISYKESYEFDDYMVLPFSMKVESSSDNFYKFLEYIETSGNLDNQVRLMEVTDIAISLSDSDDDLLSFSLELNAYFQK
ncbi:MAG: hypothetical protein ABII07_04795 [Patescibacteria group bacterium]|nr:hypothetical protein [Patescibacteria group bacterium]